MSNNLFRRLAQAALMLVCLGASIAETTAGSFTRGCAWRDMQILMLIEQHEQADVVHKRQMTDAIQKMLHARIVCYEGRVVDALKIYDTIDRALAPNTVLTREIN